MNIRRQSYLYLHQTENYLFKYKFDLRNNILYYLFSTLKLAQLSISTRK